MTDAAYLRHMCEAKFHSRFPAPSLILGLALLVLGAVTLIALILPAKEPAPSEPEER